MHLTFVVLVLVALILTCDVIVYRLQAVIYDLPYHCNGPCNPLDDWKYREQHHLVSLELNPGPQQCKLSSGNIYIYIYYIRFLALGPC